jgi:hypothetical protein
MIQVIECLLSNHEVLGSFPFRAKKKLLSLVTTPRKVSSLSR